MTSHSGGVTSGISSSSLQVKDNEKKSDSPSKEKKKDLPSVPYYKLYRYASPLDIFLMVIASICAIGSGVTMPLFSVLFGNITNAINIADPTSFNSAVNQTSLNFLYLAIAAAGLGYLSQSLPMYASECQLGRIRSAYFSALLRQESTWYDLNDSGEVNRLVDDTLGIQAGIGEKVSLTLTSVAQFFAGIIIAFVIAPKSWQLTLVLLAFMPLLGAAGASMASIFTSAEKAGLEGYAKAGAAANEVLTSIRNVAAFHAEQAEIDRYDKYLEIAEKANTKKSIGTGLTLGLMIFIIFMNYAVGLWYGSVLVIGSLNNNPLCATQPTLDGCFSGGQVLQVMFAVIIGAFAIGQIAPNASTLMSATASAAKIFHVIDRVPEIDATSKSGFIPADSDFKGHFEFKAISFHYPSRPDQKIFNKLSFEIKAGTKVAFCGTSGSGKSTITALLLRFYDPTEGEILLDGRNLKEYNVAWLRSHMGIVQQEPVLFRLSIAENIVLGIPGPFQSLQSQVKAKQQEIIAAAKAANAHEFITALADGYNTQISSSQLSGGQKQRIALARMLIRKPKLVILDEATSALDTQSERFVQASIDHMLTKSDGQVTSVSIAHRLSTIIHSDMIIVLDQGTIKECGSHAELMELNLIYAQMYNLQRLSESKKHDSSHVLNEFSAHESLHSIKSTSTSSLDSADTSVVLSNPMHHSAAAPRNAFSSTTISTPKPKEEKKSDPKIKDLDEHLIGYEKYPQVPSARVWKYQRPEYLYLVIAVFSALVNGAIMPSFAIILSGMTNVYYSSNTSTIQSQSIVYLCSFIGLAVAGFIFNFLQAALFGWMGGKLVRRLRRDTFKHILKNEIGWFDLPENAPGRLTARLSMDCFYIKGAMGERLGIVVQNAGALIVGIIIAFVSSWRISLVILAASPLMVISGVFEMKMFAGLTGQQQKAFEECGHVAQEAMASNRLIAAFGLQPFFSQKFEEALKLPTDTGKRKSWVGGIGVGLGQFLMLSVYALCFWAGAQFINRGWMTFQELLTSFFAIAFAASGIGQATAFLTDQAKSDAARRSVFAIIDRVSLIDPFTNEGKVAGASEGKVEFKNVSFSYPTRPHQLVLDGLSFSAYPGETVALVGPSGCGKSSIIALLERFYDPAEGSIELDDVALKDYSIESLRAQEGWVQQEASIPSDSIAYAIEYGTRSAVKSAPDAGMPRDAPAGSEIPSSFKVSDDAVAAAKDANAYDFISSFPHGFATHVGDRGSALSGGQKQRIAIARAIIRSPQILLLDEATSALDSNSERVVTETIDRLIEERKNSATKGVTFVIAHRLSTIKNADKIIVIEKGKKIQEGTHKQLLAQENGLYRTLAMAQDPDCLKEIE
jgi:ATP-binding cassette, subfamily B (MDR/TAP), member 1